MNIKIYTSKVSGTVTAPSSKSVTHRAIIIASLARGISTIKNILLSEDTQYTINALQQLGVRIEQKGTTLIIYGSEGKLTAPKQPIFVGNSGSTLRMLTAVSHLCNGAIITGEKRLQERPIKDLLNGLKQFETGTITIDGSKSSQYITALLLIAPFAKKGLTILITGELRSKPYVSLTINIMKTFGVAVKNDDFKKFVVEKEQTYQSKNYTIEGDYSSASYFFAAAAITKSTVTVQNLNIKSLQADKYFLEILSKMGCAVLQNKNSVTVTGTKTLSGITVDMNDCPDIVQTLAIVAAFAKGETLIKNISHLKDKETDRLHATAYTLEKMGIKAVATNDSLRITGGKPCGALINTYNDHRMAMSFAIVALGVHDEILIQNTEVVNKSYPNFWKDLQSIGAKIEKI